MDAVNRHGRVLIDDDRAHRNSPGVLDWNPPSRSGEIHLSVINDPNRIGNTVAVGLDEVLFCREGQFKHRLWSTQVVDVKILLNRLPF